MAKNPFYQFLLLTLFCAAVLVQVSGLLQLSLSAGCSWLSLCFQENCHNCFPLIIMNLRCRFCQGNEQIYTRKAFDVFNDLSYYVMGSRVQMALNNHHSLNFKNSPKTSLIGSVAPICTYNECRGCKYECKAEQVPVEGNDPINSAYYYKCVCHR